MASIILCNLPFASAKRPSLQAGLLKGLAEQAGWRCSTLHLNLDFAVLIGSERYELLCQHRGVQLSDWLFSVAAFGASAPDPDGQLLQDLPPSFFTELQRLDIDDAPAWLLRLRHAVVPAYVSACGQAVLAADAEVVGFTSTFQQNTASFALARWLKQAQPRIQTLFGGANFDDVMGLEYVRSVPAVDFAAIGEADDSFPRWLRAMAKGEDAGAVEGIASRRPDGSVRYQPVGKPFERLDDLPVPDYAEYFTRAERLGFFDGQAGRAVDLPVEGARGCWWGEKHHCVFCGLNAGTMKFRSKSPQRFVDEVTALTRNYRSLHIETVDNIIDMSYFQTVLPIMQQLKASWNIFYEVKSNLTPDQIATLANAGVRRIQPGIESLSSPVLKLMRKGVRGIQNVNLLRWCRYHGIRVSWNLLWGFPGEAREHYDEQRALLPKLVHLQPPDGCGRLWMERFSPLYTQRELLGVTDIRPSASYRHVYPETVDLSRAAYFFDYAVQGALPDETFHPIAEFIEQWRTWAKGTPRPQLSCQSAPGYVRITDTRTPDRTGAYELGDELATVYQAFLDRPTSADMVARSTGIEVGRVHEAVQAFVDRELMMQEDTLALALAVPERAPT
ncbi:RiPP maturation radical SAM C-methyltransferase [Roseateles amylovorans]|uniref:RiPP maturation radical SAM C-methyltransferase n=1 Tax=Roseateles amylovorans TaxID=2978473 RepID=A0ABY6AVG9_9BURK|nr:RiPP maturation radical SAM C-methyltransferase [Roseateles amylovorans]UXH76374.1 RiPP maturation radical SAM C-methyltransferase [Roseateles amylovorans]